MHHDRSMIDRRGLLKSAACTSAALATGLGAPSILRAQSDVLATHQFSQALHSGGGGIRRCRHV
jgi:nitrous oxide reductase